METTSHRVVFVIKKDAIAVFLAMWQCAYSEFYFCDTLWPDFDEKEFDKALVAYQQRERRFGGLKQEKQK